MARTGSGFTSLSDTAPAELAMRCRPSGKGGREVAMRGARLRANDAAGSVPRGAPELLRMDVTAATAHWGMEVPIARRDRKCGTRKRKQ